MIKNYLRTAFRHLWQNKLFSSINILGLSIGISAALVIFLIVHYEFSFDKFQKDPDRIYRVVIDAKFNGVEGHSAGVQAPLAKAVATEMTGIELTVPVMGFQGDGTVKVEIPRSNARPIVYKKQADIIFTNADYFRLMPYRWAAGSGQSSLQDPFSVVLTASRAEQYFPGISPAEIVGKKIIYNGDLTASVSGVVNDLHQQTDLSSQEFLSYNTIAKTNLDKMFMMDVWNDWMAYSKLYVKLTKDANAVTAEKQLGMIVSKYDKDANKNAANTFRFHLQPLSDMHFNNLYQAFDQRIANRNVLMGLLAIAASLLLLGCINFINLTTAQASGRAKEIGIRKTLGGSKSQLIFQYLGETFLITLIATAVSAVLAPILLRIFRDFTPAGLPLDAWHQPPILLFLFILTIAVSFLSGLYPALILSAFKPVTILKNQIVSGTAQSRSTTVRKTLTVAQFVIAQFFVMATLMVSKQINFSLHGDMGFNKDAVITFELPRDTVKQHAVQLLQDIRSLPGVAIASTGFMAPAEQGAAFTNISYDNGKDIKSPDVNVQIRWGSPAFLKVYQIPLVAGRNVAESDTIKEFLINETYAKALGFARPQDAVGKGLNWNNKTVPIVGVMKDFHDQSMRTTISAVVFGGQPGSTFHIKMFPNGNGARSWNATLSTIGSLYKKLYPEEDFKYSFIDEMVANFYATEQHTASLLNWATALAVLISCLGLLGLVIYTTNSRTKEIGIRKVLGASVANLVAILSKDFIRLVVLAFAIAAPLAWWAVYTWLQEFAYKTPMSWWVFAVSGMAMLVVAMLTLGAQVFGTARANPVKSLRTE